MIGDVLKFVKKTASLILTNQEVTSKTTHKLTKDNALIVPSTHFMLKAIYRDVIRVVNDYITRHTSTRLRSSLLCPCSSDYDPFYAWGKSKTKLWLTTIKNKTRPALRSSFAWSSSSADTMKQSCWFCQRVQLGLNGKIEPSYYSPWSTCLQKISKPKIAELKDWVNVFSFDMQVILKAGKFVVVQQWELGKM